MNELEQWLLEQWVNDIRTLNGMVGPMDQVRFERMQDVIEVLAMRGRAIASRVVKAHDLLAKLKLTVKMPEEGDAAEKTKA